MDRLGRLCAGRRVLLVDAIRSDVPSGGATITARIRAALATAVECRMLDLAPTARDGRGRLGLWTSAILNLPAPIFVILSRRLPWTWLEFLPRTSLLAVIRCLWLRWRYWPEVVIFNHHASFLYSRLFAGRNICLIWHDVPSLKQRVGGRGRRDVRVCARIERWTAQPSCIAFTFSYGERRFLARFHGLDASLLPAVAPTPLAITTDRCPDRLLLLGNWARRENRDGAFEFFRALGASPVAHDAFKPTRYVVAGRGADEFLRWVRGRMPGMDRISVEAVPRFDSLSGFDTCALVAPIAEGAGIKIKTLEAWSAGLPVLGTSQAFTGVPARVWRLGGRRFETIQALATYCAVADGRQEQLSALNPAQAFAAYLQLSDTA